MREKVSTIDHKVESPEGPVIAREFRTEKFLTLQDMGGPSSAECLSAMQDIELELARTAEELARLTNRQRILERSKSLLAIGFRSN